MPKTNLKFARKMSPHLLKKILEDIRARDSQIRKPENKFAVALFLSFGEGTIYAKDYKFLKNADADADNNEIDLIAIGQETADRNDWKEYTDQKVLESESSAAIQAATALFAALPALIDEVDPHKDVQIANNLNIILNNGRTDSRPEFNISPTSGNFKHWKQLLIEISARVKDTRTPGGHREDVEDKLKKAIEITESFFRGYKNRNSNLKLDPDVELAKDKAKTASGQISIELLDEISSLYEEMEDTVQYISAGYNSDDAELINVNIDNEMANINAQFDRYKLKISRIQNNIDNPPDTPNGEPADRTVVDREMLGLANRLKDINIQYGDLKNKLLAVKAKTELNTLVKQIKNLDATNITLSKQNFDIDVATFKAHLEGHQSKLRAIIMDAKTDDVLPRIADKTEEVQKAINNKSNELDMQIKAFFIKAAIQIITTQLQDNLQSLQTHLTNNNLTTSVLDLLLNKSSSYSNPVNEIRDNLDNLGENHNKVTLETEFSKLMYLWDKLNNDVVDQLKTKIIAVGEKTQAVATAIPSIGADDFYTKIKTARTRIQELDLELKDILIPNSLNFSELTMLWNDTNKKIDTTSSDIDARVIADDISINLKSLEASIQTSADELKDAATKNTVSEKLLITLEAKANDYTDEYNSLLDKMITPLPPSEDKTLLTAQHAGLEQPLQALNTAIQAAAARLKFKDQVNAIIQEMETDIDTIFSEMTSNLTTKAFEFDKGLIPNLTDIQNKNYPARIKALKDQIGVRIDTSLLELIHKLDSTYKTLNLTTINARGLVLQAKIDELQGKMDRDLNILHNNLVTDPQTLQPISFKDPTALTTIKANIDGTGDQPSYKAQVDELNSQKKTLVTDAGTLNPTSLAKVKSSADNLQPTLDKLQTDFDLANSFKAPTANPPSSPKPWDFDSLQVLLHTIATHAGIRQTQQVWKFNQIYMNLKNAENAKDSDAYGQVLTELRKLREPSLENIRAAMNVYGKDIKEAFDRKDLLKPTTSDHQKLLALLVNYNEMNTAICDIENNPIELTLSDHTWIVPQDKDEIKFLEGQGFRNNLQTPVIQVTDRTKSHQMLLVGKKDISVCYLDQKGSAAYMITERKEGVLTQTVTVPEMLNPVAILSNAAFLKAGINAPTQQENIKDFISTMINKFERESIPFTAKNFQKHFIATGFNHFSKREKFLATELETAYNQAMNPKILYQLAAKMVFKYMQPRGIPVDQWGGENLEVSNITMGPAAAQALADFAALHKMKLIIRSPRAYVGLVGDPKKVDKLIQKDPTFNKLMYPKGQLAELTSASATAAASSPASSPSPALSLSPAPSSPSSRPLPSSSQWPTTTPPILTINNDNNNDPVSPKSSNLTATPTTRTPTSPRRGSSSSSSSSSS